MIPLSLTASLRFLLNVRCANAVGAPHSSAASSNPAFPADHSSPGASFSACDPKPGPLSMEPPATGTRKAKVLYDYDAHDASELSLLADEVQQDQPKAKTFYFGSWMMMMMMMS